MNALEGLLHEIGLSEYEAKTLICLRAHGTSTADEISRMAKIPLPRVYDTIDKLIKMGFVLSTKTRPKRYKPIQPRVAFDHYIRHRRREFEDDMDVMKKTCTRIVNDFSKLIPEKKPPKGEDWRIWSTKNKSNVVSIRNNAIMKAGKEILMFSGDASFIRDDFDTFKKLAKKGVKMKLLLHKPENDEVRRNIEILKKFGVEVRTGYKGSMRGHVIDNTLMTMVLKWGKQSFTGKPGTDKEFRYEMLIINNPVFVNVMKEHFDLIWEGFSY